jgi:hypothetical protein
MATLEDISIRGLDEPSDVDATEKKADNKEKFSIPPMFAKNPFRLIGLTSIDSESVYWCSHDRLASVCSFWTNALSIDPQMIKEETIRIEATDKALVRVLSNFHSTHDCPLYKDDDKWTDVVEVFMLCFMWEYKKGIQLGLDRFAEHRPMTLDCLRSLPYVITQHYPDTNREVFEAHTRAVQNGELVPEYSVKTLNHELAVQVLNSYAGVWEKPYSTDPKNGSRKKMTTKYSKFITWVGVKNGTNGLPTIRFVFVLTAKMLLTRSEKNVLRSTLSVITVVYVTRALSSVRKRRR